MEKIGYYFFLTTIKPPIKSKISLLVGLEPMYTAR